MPRFRQKGSSGDFLSAETVKGYQEGGGRLVRATFNAEAVDPRGIDNKGNSLPGNAFTASSPTHDLKGDKSKQFGGPYKSGETVTLRSLAQTRNESLSDLTKASQAQSPSALKSRKVQHANAEAEYVRFQDKLRQIDGTEAGIQQVFESFATSARVLSHSRSQAGPATLTWLGSEFAENLLTRVYAGNPNLSQESLALETKVSEWFAKEAISLLKAGHLTPKGFEVFMAGFAAGMRGISNGGDSKHSTNLHLRFADANFGDSAQAALYEALESLARADKFKATVDSCQAGLEFAGEVATLPDLVKKLLNPGRGPGQKPVADQGGLRATPSNTGGPSGPLTASAPRSSPKQNTERQDSTAQVAPANRPSAESAQSSRQNLDRQAHRDAIRSANEKYNEKTMAALERIETQISILNAQIAKILKHLEEHWRQLAASTQLPAESRSGSSAKPVQATEGVAPLESLVDHCTKLLQTISAQISHLSEQPRGQDSNGSSIAQQEKIATLEVQAKSLESELAQIRQRIHSSASLSVTVADDAFQKPPPAVVTETKQHAPSNQNTQAAISSREGGDDPDQERSTPAATGILRTAITGEPTEHLQTPESVLLQAAQQPMTSSAVASLFKGVTATGPSTQTPASRPSPEDGKATSSTPRTSPPDRASTASRKRQQPDTPSDDTDRERAGHHERTMQARAITEANDEQPAPPEQLAAQPAMGQIDPGAAPAHAGPMPGEQLQAIPVNEPPPVAPQAGANPVNENDPPAEQLPAAATHAGSGLTLPRHPADTPRPGENDATVRQAKREPEDPTEQAAIAKGEIQLPVETVAGGSVVQPHSSQNTVEQDFDPLKDPSRFVSLTSGLTDKDPFSEDELAAPGLTTTAVTATLGKPESHEASVDEEDEIESLRGSFMEHLDSDDEETIAQAETPAPLPESTAQPQATPTPVPDQTPSSDSGSDTINPASLFKEATTTGPSTDTLAARPSATDNRTTSSNSRTSPPDRASSVSQKRRQPDTPSDSTAREERLRGEHLAQARAIAVANDEPPEVPEQLAAQPAIGHLDPGVAHAQAGPMPGEQPQPVLINEQPHVAPQAGANPASENDRPAEQLPAGGSHAGSGLTLPRQTTDTSLPSESEATGAPTRDDADTQRDPTEATFPSPEDESSLLEEAHRLAEDQRSSNGNVMQEINEYLEREAQNNPGDDKPARSRGAVSEEALEVDRHLAQVNADIARLDETAAIAEAERQGALKRAATKVAETANPDGPNELDLGQVLNLFENTAGSSKPQSEPAREESQPSAMEAPLEQARAAGQAAAARLYINGEKRADFEALLERILRGLAHLSLADEALREATFRSLAQALQSDDDRQVLVDTMPELARQMVEEASGRRPPPASPTPASPGDWLGPQDAAFIAGHLAVLAQRDRPTVDILPPGNPRARQAIATLRNLLQSGATASQPAVEPHLRTATANHDQGMRAAQRLYDGLPEAPERRTDAMRQRMALELRTLASRNFTHEDHRAETLIGLVRATQPGDRGLLFAVMESVAVEMTGEAAQGGWATVGGPPTVEAAGQPQPEALWLRRGDAADAALRMVEIMLTPPPAIVSRATAQDPPANPHPEMEATLPAPEPQAQGPSPIETQTPPSTVPDDWIPPDTASGEPAVPVSRQEALHPQPQPQPQPQSQMMTTQAEAAGRVISQPQPVARIAPAQVPQTPPASDRRRKVESPFAPLLRDLIRASYADEEEASTAGGDDAALGPAVDRKALASAKDLGTRIGTTLKDSSPREQLAVLWELLDAIETTDDLDEDEVADADTIPLNLDRSVRAALFQPIADAITDDIVTQLLIGTVEHVKQDDDWSVADRAIELVAQRFIGLQKPDEAPEMATDHRSPILSAIATLNDGISATAQRRSDAQRRIRAVVLTSPMALKRLDRANRDAEPSAQEWEDIRRIVDDVNAAGPTSSRTIATPPLPLGDEEQAGPQRGQAPVQDPARPHAERAMPDLASLPQAIRASGYQAVALSQHLGQAKATAGQEVWQSLMEAIKTSMALAGRPDHGIAIAKDAKGQVLAQSMSWQDVGQRLAAELGLNQAAGEIDSDGLAQLMAAAIDKVRNVKELAALVQGLAASVHDQKLLGATRAAFKAGEMMDAVAAHPVAFRAICEALQVRLATAGKAQLPRDAREVIDLALKAMVERLSPLRDTPSGEFALLTFEGVQKELDRVRHRLATLLRSPLPQAEFAPWFGHLEQIATARALIDDRLDRFSSRPELVDVAGGEQVAWKAIGASFSAKLALQAVKPFHMADDIRQALTATLWHVDKAKHLDQLTRGLVVDAHEENLPLVARQALLAAMDMDSTKGAAVVVRSVFASIKARLDAMTQDAHRAAHVRRDQDRINAEIAQLAQGLPAHATSKRALMVLARDSFSPAAAGRPEDSKGAPKKGS